MISQNQLYPQYMAYAYIAKQNQSQEAEENSVVLNVSKHITNP